ncbi:chemotaxis protein MotB [Gammaproteobacteria bacterium]
MADERPIIIKRVKKIAAGSHGGAWKLAYADFVTAMMAFFLLMWLLGSTTEGDKKGIADFFQNPFKPSLSGGRGSGDATSVIDGGGDDLTRSTGQVKKTNKGTQELITVTAEETEGNKNIRKSGLAEEPTDDLKEAANPASAETEADLTAQEVITLQRAKDKLQDMINRSEILHPYSDQFQIDITTEGLRIQIVDEEKRPMFDIGSVRMETYATEIMRQIAPVIDQLPNRITITGHTDGRPYGGAGRGYSNWELSADRANAARRALVIGGIKENKFMRVVGLADSIPLDPNDVLNPINRRISIIVMKRIIEQQLRESSGPVIEVGKGAAPPSPNTPVLFPPVVPPPAPPPVRSITQPVRPGQSSTQPAPSARPVPPSVLPIAPPIQPIPQPIKSPVGQVVQPPLPSTRSATVLPAGRTGIR